MVNDITSETMLIIYLKEAFTNEFEEITNSAETGLTNDEPRDEEEASTAAIIKGPDSGYPFDTLEYTVQNADNGTWFLSNTKAKINNSTSTKITLTIVTAKSGSIDLIYKRDNEDDIVKTITIKSL